ncbi:RHS repeat-associated core domain-containing protein, partial [Patescibacteria group bacterium]|nr:RHS repeat-associated core domain-containing protein [Patescibacteria group bacterium]
DKELDDETGLMYYGARYYDPVIGRFLAVDPLVLDEAVTTEQNLQDILHNPQMLNGYSYALNNPVLFVDLFGESAVTMEGFGQMLDGTVKTVLGLFPIFSKNPAKAAVGWSLSYSGARDIGKGFYQAVSDTDVGESITEQTVDYGVKTAGKKGLKFGTKIIYGKVYNFSFFSDSFRKIGEKVEKAGESFGNKIRSMLKKDNINEATNNNENNQLNVNNSQTQSSVQYDNTHFNKINFDLYSEKEDNSNEDQNKTD